MNSRSYCKSVVGFLSVLVLLSLSSAKASDVLTQHVNKARTGAVLDETILHTGNVNTSNFGKLWTLFADGQVVAQPLYVSNLAIDTSTNPDAPRVQGTFNAVIIATMHNTVYVYDADKEKRGPDGRTIPLWATWLGEPRPGGKDIDMFSTNDPEWGILSTPVISDDKATIYVVAWHNDGPAGLRFRLHALNLKSGAHRMPAVPIGPSSTDPSQPCRAQSPFSPCKHKQRAALLLDRGILYIGFGGDGNRGTLYAFDAQTLAQKAVWLATPTGENGGLWQSGQGASADADGNIYVMTGNGSFNANTNGRNYGSSFVKLKLEGSNLVVKDYFTPCNFQFLNQLDLDLGSSGPMLLPTNPPRILGGGKEGILYVLSPANMGKFVASPGAPNCQNANAIQQVLAFDKLSHDGQDHYGNIHGSPVYWKGPDKERIYAWGENSQLKAFVFGQGKLQDIANPKKSGFRPPDGMPGGMLSVSANGSRAGTGILWAVVPLDGDANTHRGVKGIVLALDAQDVSRTLWTSEQFAQRDRLGLFAKFATPVVANGKVFVPTYGDDEPLRRYDGAARPAPATLPRNYYVAVYGMLQPDSPRPVVVNQNTDDVTVVRAGTSPLTLNTAMCAPAANGQVDCTDRLSDAGQAPSFHRFVVGANSNLAGCVLLRVTVASKNAGISNSHGIGFWSALSTAGEQAAENQGRFVSTGQLKAVGSATLLNGAAATLHEFVGVSNCSAGGESLSRLFKPYMDFMGGPDGRIFRNWDKAENYRIGPDVLQFDRSADVLRP